MLKKEAILKEEALRVWGHFGDVFHQVQVRRGGGGMRQIGLQSPWGCTTQKAGNDRERQPAPTPTHTHTTHSAFMAIHRVGEAQGQ